MPSDARRAHALQDLRCAAGLWLAVPENQHHAADLIMAAAHALAAGIDTPGLQTLAGFSTRGVVPWELPEALGAVSDELVLTLPDCRSGEALVLAAQVLSRQLLDGLITSRAVAAWAHEHVGHDGPAALQSLVDLDDLYDIHGPAEDLDLEVATAAQALVDLRPTDVC